MHIKGGSVVEFRSAQEPDNLRAGNYAYFWGDEAAGFSEYAFQVANATIRQPGYPPRRVFTTTPAWQNWLYRLFVLSKDERYRLFSGIATEVNKANLPASFIPDLMAQYGGAESPFAQQELYGLFVAQTGQVYSLFDRKKHLKSNFRVDFKYIFAGVDWGGRAPFALVVVGIDHENRYWVIDEYYKSGITVNEFAQACKLMSKKWPINKFLCDGTQPAGVLLLRQMGLPAISMKHQGREWIKQGVMRISALFEQRADGSYSIYVHPKCESFIRELESYRWPDQREGGPEADNPVKANDHALDAFRYVNEYYYRMTLGAQAGIGKSAPFSVTRKKNPKVRAIREYLKDTRYQYVTPTEDGPIIKDKASI